MEQKLIDLLFQVASTISDPANHPYFDSITHEQRMAWVAQQLRECGFDTAPCGSSWGVLKH